MPHKPHAQLGALSELVSATWRSLHEQKVAERVWQRDATLWSTDNAAVASISGRLGWLDSPEDMQDKLAAIEQFAAAVAQAGYRQCLLLGMGGSSLCPEVLRKTFGVGEDCLDVRVLDSTDPVAVLDAAAWAEREQTLFLVASKSGFTTEVRSFYQYFAAKVGDPARFVAITDAGTALQTLAQDAGFLQTFLNPADIGGRYSALSFFGLVPGALGGLPLHRFMSVAREMARACGASIPTSENPGLWLGGILGAAHQAGRDKMTLVLSPRVAALGSWIEQLVAESTGKDGRGIVPIDGETLGPPDVYADDRLFVHLPIGEDADTGARLAALRAAGHPVVTIPLLDPMQLGGEFFRWQMATAVAAVVIGINPFDEPNVSESKKLTTELLAVHARDGALPANEPMLTGDTLDFFVDPDLKVNGSGQSVLAAHLARRKPGDYLALLAYLPRHGVEPLEDLRDQARDALAMACTLGVGPRFLHSTGQLHKGGADRGLFIQITCDDADAVPVPNAGYDFSTLKQAQALGDMRALLAHGRRVVRCHIRGDLDAGLRELVAMFAAATG